MAELYGMMLWLFPAWALGLAWGVAIGLMVVLAWRVQPVVLDRYGLLMLAMPMAAWVLFYFLIVFDSGGGLHMLRGQALSRLASAWMVSTILLMAGRELWKSHQLTLWRSLE